MVYGATSRPMFPEYSGVHRTDRNLLLLDSDNVVWTERGRRLGTFSAPELVNMLERENGMLFIESFMSEQFDEYFTWLLHSKVAEIMCDKRGNANMARIAAKNMRWVTQCDVWNIAPTIDGLKELRQLFSYFGLGVAPTPGSLGKRTMHYIYHEHNLKRHTALSLAAERYLFENGHGGIVHTDKRYIGVTTRKVDLFDETFAYIASYRIHPDGGAEWFQEGDDISHYATWFGQCVVTIRKELPIGVFPARDEKHRVRYPTKPGRYITFLWRERAIYAQEKGCTVRVLDGWGWRSLTGDNGLWAEYIYYKRQGAFSDKMAKRVKGIGVAAIGRHGLGREHYILVGKEKYNPETDFPLISNGIPIELWVSPRYDGTSSPLVHWQRYTIDQVNGQVVDFAYPFAESDKVILLDHDAVMVLPLHSTKGLVKKDSLESLSVAPGTWLWCRQHNVHFYANRIWLSDEEPDKYGRNLLHYVRDGVLK